MGQGVPDAQACRRVSAGLGLHVNAGLETFQGSTFEKVETQLKSTLERARSEGLFRQKPLIEASDPHLHSIFADSPRCRTIPTGTALELCSI